MQAIINAKLILEDGIIFDGAITWAVFIWKAPTWQASAATRRRSAGQAL